MGLGNAISHYPLDTILAQHKCVLMFIDRLSQKHCNNDYDLGDLRTKIFAQLLQVVTQQHDQACRFVNCDCGDAWIARK